MRKFFFWLALFFLGSAYLLLPFGSLPALPDSLKSDEPGDTVEISGVSAYYTNLKREEVVTFYRQHYAQTGFLALPLIVLNHPPEYGKEAIRDTTESTFLYELVQIGRGSLFINGFDPAEHPELKKAKDPAKIINKDGRFWERKIILREMPAFFLSRLIVFWLFLITFFILWQQFKQIIISFWPKKKSK